MTPDSQDQTRVNFFPIKSEFFKKVERINTMLADLGEQHHSDAAVCWGKVHRSFKAPEQTSLYSLAFNHENPLLQLCKSNLIIRWSPFSSPDAVDSTGGAGDNMVTETLNLSKNIPTFIRLAFVVNND